jgi:Endosomal/lysosomal potassium channel TMEM175
LLHGLLALWPSYLAYVVTFLFIGQVWVNHHVMFDHIGAANLLSESLDSVGATAIGRPPARVLVPCNRLGGGSDRGVQRLLLASDPRRDPGSVRTRRRPALMRYRPLERSASMTTNWLGDIPELADTTTAGPVFAGQKLVVVGGSSGMGRQTASDPVAAGGSAVIIGQDPGNVDGGVTAGRN